MLKSNQRKILVATLGALCLMASTCQQPDVTQVSKVESVGFQGQVEFEDDGVVRRQVRVSIPAGALANATGGEVGIGTSTSTSAPISAVQFEVGEPGPGSTVIDEIGQAVESFPWTLPDDCAEGCEVVFPVTIRHIGEAAPPRIGWQFQLTVNYEGLEHIPENATDMELTIEDPEP